MKTISSNIQRWIMFIPGINWINFVIWMYNCRAANFPGKLYVKGMAISAIYIAFSWFSAQQLGRIFPEYASIIMWLCRYLAFLLLGYKLIHMQEQNGI